MEAAIFVVCAAIVLGGAFGVVLSRNPVHSALSLVATLFGIAVLFLEPDAQLLAAVQVIVYTGAIVVLILFVLMLLGVDRDEDIDVEPIVGQRACAVVVGRAASVLGILVGHPHRRLGTSSPGRARATERARRRPTGNIGQIGRPALHHYVFAFEITAGLLTIAVVGAVVLARRPRTPAAPRARADRRARRRDAPRRGRGAALMREPRRPPYLVLGAMLFSIGAVGCSYRRNPLVMLMCVELMLNAVNLTS